jgi:uncharacterized membrane protein (DUF485 family)
MLRHSGERGMDGITAKASQQSAHPTEWDRIAESKEFKHLIAIKKTFIVPAFIFFFVHYLALAVLVGYAPRIASTRLIGTVNVAYLFVLAQFIVGWAIAGLYLLAAAKFDALTKDILAQVDQHSGGR